MSAAAEEQQEEQTGREVAVQRKGSPIPLYNGVMSPDRWTMFGRMAHVIASTDFAPKGMRGKPDAVMAALLYGDSLDLHPSVTLTDVFIVDGKPGISGALMLAKIRQAGHRVTFKALYEEDGTYRGAVCSAQRREDGEVVEEDSWTFTMDDARRAGLVPGAEKAAWTKYPETMCRWRALSQVARFLFPDVFRGQAVYTPEEAEEIAFANRQTVDGAASAVPPGGEDDDLVIEYGDEPLLAMRLIELFQAANEAVSGSYRPRKVQAMLAGKSERERREIAVEVEAFIVKNGGVVPPEPSDSTREEPEEKIEDADFTVLDEEQEKLPGT